MSLSPSSMVSQYRVERRLGAGGMGEVYLARDTALDRFVALKVMSAELAQEEHQRRRFRAEAKAASGLVHPNICVIHDVGEAPDHRPFLAMEYIQGETLESILRERRLRLRESIRLGIQVAEALAAAHAQGIIHRDIKPGNIMLDKEGRVKVLDFGLAKRVRKNDLSTLSTAAHTQPGMLIGTPHYMSPEQVLGHELDARADIFSLGAVLYELVAGQKAFTGTTIGETINNVVNKEPEPLGLENPLYSPALDQIIFKCLAKDPARRYATARDLASDLSDLHEKTTRPSVPAPNTLSQPETPAANPELIGAGKNVPAPAGDKARKFLVWLTAALVFLTGGYALLNFLGAARGTKPPAKPTVSVGQKSVAVLPFDNFSSEPDTEYLSDGLTEEITTALSRIRGLKVAARNSAYAFKGRKEDVRRIGEMLRVNTILEGSVRKSGNELRVVAQLINTADGFHLWSETYERSVDDLFAVQQEIATRIAERLQGKSSPEPVAVVRPVNREAHTLYLQARQAWNKRTLTGLQRAVRLFTEAVAKDPGYADAHAGLGATYLLMPLYSAEAPAKEYRQLAGAAVDRALALNTNCPEAHAVLAELKHAAHDLKGAETHFQRALEVDPNYATAHHWYGRFLNLNGQRERGLAELKIAVDLDPLSPIIHTTIPEWYYLGGDYDTAILEGKKVVETFPDFPLARTMVAVSYLKKRDYAEALTYLDQVRALQPDDPDAVIELRGYVLARSGREEEARKILAELEARHAAGQKGEGRIAFLLLGLKDYDKAMDTLEELVSREGLSDIELQDPLMQEFGSLPRFQQLVARQRQKKELLLP